jgi:hypothetical protein
MNRMKPMTKGVLLAIAISVSLAGPMFAQFTHVMVRLRGKIDTVSGNTLHLTLRNGKQATATLATNAPVTWLAPAKPTDIATGSYIGTA